MNKSLKPRDYFPLGKAHGEAFCNREKEKEWLIANTKAGKHSLIIAPRRYGKSSLAEKTTNISGLPVTILNFNTCSDEHDVELLIRQGVSQLIGRTFGAVDKITHSMKSYVKHITPKISIGSEYAHLELTANKQSLPSANIEETLALMEKLLIEKKKSAVLIFDEFQVVGLIAKGRGVEAAIRNAAQEMKHLAIIFSGSNRSLLQLMFEDESRPLYKICRKLRLKRIDKIHYQKHLNHAAHLSWKKKLDEEVFERIMLLSERHPYYVNYLCDVIWTDCDKTPKMTDIDRAWRTVIEEECSDANAEIATLSMGQKKLLKHIAHYSGEQLLSSNTIKILGMALSSISSALTALIEKDMIEKENQNYNIINPVIKCLLQEPISEIV